MKRSSLQYSKGALGALLLCYPVYSTSMSQTSQKFECEDAAMTILQQLSVKPNLSAYFKSLSENEVQDLFQRLSVELFLKYPCEMSRMVYLLEKNGSSAFLNMLKSILLRNKRRQKVFSLKLLAGQKCARLLEDAREGLPQELFVYCEQLARGRSCPDSLLQYAIKEGESELVRLALKYWAYPFESDGLGRTSLHYAAVRGNSDVIEELMASDYAVSASELDLFGCTPLDYALINNHQEAAHLLQCYFFAEHKPPSELHVAAACKNIPKVRRLCIGNSRDTFSKYQQTPLHCAAAAGHSEIVTILLEAGLQPSAKPLQRPSLRDIDESYFKVMYRCNYSFFQTPLQYAIISGQEEIVVRLLKVDTAINDDNNYLHDLCCLAIKNKQYATFKRLLGIEPHQKMPLTKLYSVMISGLRESNRLLRLAVIAGKKFVKLLLKVGIVATARDLEGRTPLMLAVLYRNVDTVKLLLTTGAKIGSKDKVKRTALHYAAINGSFYCLQMLLLGELKIINTRDDHGCTPLYYAASFGHNECMKPLLKRGADKDMQSAYGISPLAIATKNQHISCVELLLAQGANPNTKEDNGFTPLHYAVGKGNIPCLKLLLDNGANPNSPNVFGRTPLYYASKVGNSEGLQLLVNTTEDINGSLSLDGCTPLMIATCGGYSLCVKQLVDKGAQINKANKSGQTALTFASMLGNNICLKILLRAGADVNVQDKVNGATPLMYAAFYGYDCCVRYLLSYGATLCIKDTFGKTALEHACYRGNSDCLDIIKEFS